MSEIQVGQINSTDGSTAITTGADGYVSFAKTQIGGRRNLIINGAMQVAQRGTTTISAGNNKYGGPDRFRQQNDGDGAVSVSQSTESPDGFGYSMKVDVTTADSSLDADDMYRIQTRFEGQNLQGLKKGTSGAESLTLSFWVRSPKTGAHIVNLYDSDNTRLIAKSYTVSTADTWEHKTITLAGDTTGAFNNDNSLSLSIYWYLCAGTNWSSGTLATDWEAYTKANTAVGQVNCLDNTANNFYLTGVQLEVGTVATPFEHRSYGEELALCQRYYWRMNGRGVLNMTNKYTTDQTYTPISLPVTMRSTPTFDHANGTNYYRYYANSTSAYFGGFSGVQGAQEGSLDRVMIYSITSAFNISSNGTSGWIQLFDTNAYIAFEAEL